MHGRPRKSSGDGEKDVAEAARLQSLQTQFFKNHHDKIYSKEALEISASLAEINPEIYTVWNYRKMAVKFLLESEGDGDAIREILNGELRLVERALKRNFKSYCPWYHRKWVINMGYLDSSLDREFQLLDQFLKADGRNFHGWNYRRFVAALKKVPDEEELNFTTKKINENFSNYSAWHNRSVLLSNLLKNKFEEINSKQVLTEEYELVQQALFTDSDDQSGWFYHLWLLGQTVSQNGPRLVATWPSNGSDLAIQLQEQSHIHVTFDNPFGTDQFIFSEGIPLVLHFSEPVKGVNSSTITVNSLLAESEVLWKPLSAYGLEAKTWVAILRLPPDFNTNTTYTVEVNVDSLGIISSNGCNLASPMVLNFSLDVQLATANDMLQELETVELAWEGEIFSPVDIGQDKFPTLSQFCQDIHSPERSWHNETLESEIKVFRELLEIEMDSKWAKLTLARLLMAQDTLSSGSILGNTRMNTDEVLQLFNELIDIDSSHANYYKDQSSLILFDQVTGSKEKLQDYIWESVSIDFISHGQQNIWLRLNGLSLSRIGCMERLLWLQNLDISHNRLRSIDGLEALQLLSCLNLSHNLLPNFTALAPLRLIMTLTALNIAYNEIGSHSIDTTRYSFPSVLNNSSASTKEFSGDMEQDNLECSWEITLMFKGLHLRQLDTAGNPAIDENCKISLKKILPTLKWLDGTRVA
ncbi:hypothetical protein SUGI_0907570 [Cryptomeria japonica]|uniref:geranylgeranyl transferase type-2 subunit alpha 1 n=1 Tax=Cryptomeria japonica TaxID=3369 RepID=UPI0024149561|nr:geranylgeranyl transferase type-2 subunit alpha 1 [Cryptomeria japonica]GLJ43606.1 hypothetical protein SUGI_0907570 [Cryptomeria japonica]